MLTGAMSTRTVRIALLTASLAIAAACAGTPEIPRENQAIRDYVEVGELEGVDSMRTRDSDQWKPITDYYVLYKGRDGQFLLGFSRICRELTDNTKIKPDYRYDHNVMRRGLDTLRGCRIDEMYPLTDAQAQEIKALT
jgi:hypothetical protein